MKCGFLRESRSVSSEDGGRLTRSAVLLLCFSLFMNMVCFAQSTNSGDIRGTVTDTSGAVMTGVKVSVLNVDTGISKDYITNQDGVFDTSSVMVGRYTLTFDKEGFEKLARGPISVAVGLTTVNAELRVGSAQQTVTVTADVPLLNTESGDQTTTLESKDMAQLPQAGDWQNFTILLPGTSGNALAAAGSANPGQLFSANGNLPYTNILADGASTTLGASQNSNTAIFETVREVQVSLSSFSAQYGIGGVIINQITKSGTNQFHGSAYEYFQNDALNAADYGFGNKVPVPLIRYNNFGGSIGGPILKKKMFFFFDYDRIVRHSAASSSYSTIPTAAVMSGDFTGQKLIYDPTTQTTAFDSGGNPYPVRRSFQDEYGYNGFPSDIFDAVSAKLQQWYPTPTNHIKGGQFVPGTLTSTGLLQNNFYSSVPSSRPHIAYFGRLDYDITPNNRLGISALDSDIPLFSPSAVTACPVGCQPADGEDINSQISDTWNISNRTFNEFRFGYTYEVNTFHDPTLGKGYPSQLAWQFAKANGFPTINQTDYYSLAPGVNATGAESVFDISDVLTMVRGRHILHLGGEMLLYREDDVPWGNVNAGTFQFTGQYTQNWVVDPITGLASPDATSGLGYADFLLGLAQGWNAAVSPEYGGRMKSPQMFIEDDYKIRPNLTVSLGLRYQINHGWNEVHGNVDSFDPTVINPATNTLGAEWYGSTHANGRTSLEANVFNTILPRLGVVWSPKPNTTVRGGFGLYAYSWSLDNYGLGMYADPLGSSGNLGDDTNGITPVTKLDGSGTIYGTAVSLPYSVGSTAPDRFNGESVAYTQYHSPVPKIYEWTLSVQRQLGTDFMAQLAYVGSHGTDLPFVMDLNQVPEGKLAPNDAQFRPYLQYQGISGSTNNAISNYNSLQASITKRMTSGLSLSFNYVWSHFLDDQDSSGWGGQAGPQPYQRANDPSANYSNSSYDVRHAFKGYAVYELPFGKGKILLNTSNRLLDAVVGGWQLSGTVVLSTGNPFTVYSTHNTYALAGDAFPNWSGVSPAPTHRSINEWYNPAAFVLPENGTYGNVRRNSLYGPGLAKIDLSFGKTFSLPWEGIKFQIRADAMNALNHPSFGIPQTSLSGASGVGQPFTNPTNITWTTVGGRTVQLEGRITF